jgi:hypothetical protein
MSWNITDTMQSNERNPIKQKNYANGATWDQVTELLTRAKVSRQGQKHTWKESNTQVFYNSLLPDQLRSALVMFWASSVFLVAMLNYNLT